jgi:hypothetical protein
VAKVLPLFCGMNPMRRDRCSLGRSGVTTPTRSVVGRAVQAPGEAAGVLDHSTTGRTTTRPSASVTIGAVVLAVHRVHPRKSQ